MFNSDILYKTDVINDNLQINLSFPYFVECVYDTAGVGITPIDFGRDGYKVNLYQQPVGQLYVKYLKN